MEQAVGIALPSLGKLNGRDCIHIDTVTQENNDRLVFRGEINGALADRINDDIWIPYTLIFHHMLAYRACELDTYLNLNVYGHADCTDFNIIKNSRWLAGFPVRNDLDQSDYQHYQLFTYDYVYHIIAVSFEMRTDLPPKNGEGESVCI